MGSLQRMRAAPEQEEAPARLLPALSELRREVRALSRHAHRVALARAAGGVDDYRRQLCALFEQWVDEGAPQVQVVCFASAAEFGLPMPRHAERCRQAVMRDGSPALRALYWAALHRTRHRVGITAPMSDDAATGSTATMPTEHVPAAEPRPETPPRPLCLRCERLRRDARCAGGHGALRPLGVARARTFGDSAVCQTREHQCEACQTRWTEHRSAATPFTGWTIGRRPAMD
ncbi:hypothetical protein LMG31506_03418 [Cupriavidus yeoncheonensis]|uniref:Uncharacterized protein n=1 Tax=Cupriavidus yeoncheonensis TaxID=1462994 RepID=A0A916IU38_9BURK|nr:hypothetical protein [Cupriavidus yeoncheonensis]CAG2146628.1 hypothetical protein LMG31506_03418 [Cupriavidus yeoncheonensis]